MNSFIYSQHQLPTTMKKSLYLLPLLVIVLLVSCSKIDDNKDVTPNTNPLVFVSLTANDTILPVNGITQVAAVATGDGLTYNWTASYGTFVGSGASVMWTVCHSDVFTITCVVKDTHGNSAIKTLQMHVN